MTRAQGAQSAMPEVGPLGRNLIANMEYLRQARGLSCRKLSAELDKAGRRIPPLGLARIAKGERRVDVDELVAPAEVLGVTPDVLLATPETVKGNPAEVPPHCARPGTWSATSRACSGHQVTRKPAIWRAATSTARYGGCRSKWRNCSRHRDGRRVHRRAPQRVHYAGTRGIPRGRGKGPGSWASWTP